MPLYWLYVPVTDATVAKALAKNALNQGLAACANIFPGMHSLYWWDDKLCESEETVLLLKTTAAALPQLRAQIQANHPYELPCLASFAVEANSDFARWVESKVKASRNGDNRPKPQD